MTTLQIDPNLPEITPAQSLTGRHSEFCVELLGDGGARIFVRAVEKSSFKATELQHPASVHANTGAQFAAVLSLTLKRSTPIWTERAPYIWSGVAILTTAIDGGALVGVLVLTAAVSNWAVKFLERRRRPVGLGQAARAWRQHPNNL